MVKSAFAAVKLKEGDEVIAIEHEQKNCTLMFVTRSGMCLNADMSDIPVQGRIAAGVKGIQLADGDDCLFIGQINGDGEVVLVSDRGYSKRVLVSQIDVMARYRKGVKILDFNKKDNGTCLAFVSYVTDPYKIVLVFEDDYLSSYSTEALSIENRTHAGRPIIKGRARIKEGLVYNDKLTN